METTDGWISQPDICRCCLSSCGTWDVTASYITEGGKEDIFVDMLQDCYGITLSYLTEWGQSRMVCELCAGHLRDACSFKKQILHAEKRFNTYCQTKLDLNSLVIKTELEQIGHESPNYNDPGLDSGDDKETHKENITTHRLSKKCNKSHSTLSTHKRKRHKTVLKLKRKRKNIIEDIDSDTPISQLSNKTEMKCIINKNSRIIEFEGSIRKAVDSDSVSVNTKDSKLKKYSKLSSESCVDNRDLRSNITLILKNSTIIPFKHINTGKYMCLFCDKSYLFFKELKNHVIGKHKDVNQIDMNRCLKTPKDLIKADISEIKCKLCDQQTENIEILVKHFIEAHKLLFSSTPRIRPSHGILGFDLSSDELKCHICTKEFRFFKNLSVHMNEHSDNFICHICGKNFVSKHRLQTHVTAHRKTDTKCKYCTKIFRTTSARNYHIKKMHNGSRFKCTECPKVFDQYQHRLKHLIDVHKLKKPEFRCEICSKEYASSGGLRAHVRYSHLRSKEYACETCGKTFVYKWIWQRHLDIHAGIKNYECNFCNKKFAKPYTLDVHVRIHLNDKRFVCSVCKVAFVQKCSLKNHMRVHHSDSGIDLYNL